MSFHGWLILDKPIGISSAKGVSIVKRLMRESGHTKPKVGHGGTLDPRATGVLPIALGEATKLTGRMLNGDKTYRFTVAWGIETDSGDTEGKAVASSGARPTLNQIEGALEDFVGKLKQVPPAHSALKVGGKRAYRLVREGQEVELAERQVTIRSLRLTDNTPNAASFEAEVSKGTYIRSLGRDLARALGTVGHLSALRRTACGPFTLENAISVDILETRARERGLGSLLLPMTAGLDDIPALTVTPEEAARLKHGQHLSGRPEPDGSYIAMDGETPVAMISLISGESRTDRGFNL